MELLLQAGANVNADSMGQTPLHIAASKGNSAIVRALLAAGADPNLRDSALQHSALHTACLGGSAAVCKDLLQFGADVNARAKHGWTPLHRAAAKGHTDICQVLVGHGADVEATLDATPQNAAAGRKFANATPKHLAEAARHIDTAAFFTKVTSGLTPSMQAPEEDQNRLMFQKIAALKGTAPVAAAAPTSVDMLRKRAAQGHARARSVAGTKDDRSAAVVAPAVALNLKALSIPASKKQFPIPASLLSQTSPEIKSPRSPRSESGSLNVVAPIPLRPVVVPDGSDTESAPVDPDEQRTPRTRERRASLTVPTASLQLAVESELKAHVSNLRSQLDAMQSRVRFLEYMFLVFAVLLVVGLAT